MGSIHTAAMLGCLSDIEREIKQDRAQANAKDEAGCTPLHHAARSGYVEIMTCLLDAGAQVDAADIQGKTPLHHMAVWCTRTDAARTLIGLGANVNAQDAGGNTPLALASSCTHKPGHQWGDFNKLARFLIESGASVDVYSAIILDLRDRVEELLATDPKLHTKTNPAHYFPAGATPLHTCADRGRTELAKLIIERGADISARDSRGRTPLVLAAHKTATRRLGSTEETTQLLIQHTGELDIWEAALLGELDTLQSLLHSHPRSVNAVGPGGYTPLHLAAWNGMAEAVQLLIDQRAPLNSLSERSETPIQLAAIYRHADVASLLLEAGSSCDLFTAISLQNLPEVTKAIKADPSRATSINRRGRPALRLAMDAAGAQQTHNEIVRCLLDSGAPIDIWTAASTGSVGDILRILSNDPDAVNRYDNVVTPLHCAASSGHLEAVGILVDNGAALEATTIDLATPTIWALWSGQTETAKYLVSRGANQNALDNWSDAPWIAGSIA